MAEAEIGAGAGSRIEIEKEGFLEGQLDYMLVAKGVAQKDFAEVEHTG